MFHTYEEYLTKPITMSIAEMQDLHSRILREVNGDAEAEKLYSMLLKTSNRYIGFRANWPIWSRQEKMDRDSSRTSSHNSVMAQLKMLSRFLTSQGKDGSWIEVLGNPDTDRKRFGDFACYLAFISALNAR